MSRAFAVALAFGLFTGCHTDERNHAPTVIETAAPAVIETAAPASPASAAPLAQGDVRPANLAVPAPPTCASPTRWIPGGTLHTAERGRPVEVAGYCLDEREITVAELRSCVTSGACKRECASQSDCPAVPIHTEWNPAEDYVVSRLCNGRATDRDDHPVNCVSIGEAASYCAAQGARLPTGDEWEWAARGGAARSHAAPTPWGSLVATDEICWGKPRKRGTTCPVSAFARDTTAEGIHGLGGNVTEWVTRPARDTSSADIRWAYGASWYAIDDGYASAALGGVEMPAKRAETVGFRCARDAAR